MFVYSIFYSQLQCYNLKMKYPVLSPETSFHKVVFVIINITYTQLVVINLNTQLLSFFSTHRYLFQSAEQTCFIEGMNLECIILYDQRAIWQYVIVIIYDLWSEGHFHDWRPESHSHSIYKSRTRKLFSLYLKIYDQRVILIHNLRPENHSYGSRKSFLR